MSSNKCIRLPLGYSMITKLGLVSRDTIEMNLNKVESLHLNLGLMGRILDYGDVTVVGTGASLEPLRGIARPLELRKKLGGVAEVAVPKSNPCCAMPPLLAGRARAVGSNFLSADAALRGAADL
jgi:hypothetical protein